MTTPWSRASKPTRLLSIAILCYGVTFSVLTALKVLDLHAYAFDLGNYNQAMFTTVADRKFFYYTANLLANPSGNIFGAHFSPILVVILPFYALAPSPFTLTVVQTWAIALGAVPLYLLGIQSLKSERLALVLAVSYLLNPAVQGVNWYDFHPEAFLLPLLGLVLYYAHTRRWTALMIAAVLAIMTQEIAAVLVGFVATVELASAWRLARKSGERLERCVIIGFGRVALLSVVWLIAATSVVLAINSKNTYYGGAAPYWQILGASSLFAVPLQALFHPDRAFAALSFDGAMKAWYLVLLFGPLLFLPMRCYRALLYGLPWLSTALLSNYAPYYEIGDQYPAYVLPFLFYGAILALAKQGDSRSPFTRLGAWLGRKLRLRASRSWSVGFVLAATASLTVAASPLGLFGFGVYQTGGFPALDFHERAVDSLYPLIPPDASVLTQNNLFPLVSNRVNAFVIPIGIFYPRSTTFNSTVDTLLRSVDYILLDYATGDIEAALILSWPGLSTNYSVLASHDGAVLLHRGSAVTTSFLPYIRTVLSQTVQPQTGVEQPDASATGGKALFDGTNRTTDFWYGPSLYLPPGAYQVSYRIRVDHPVSGTLLRLPVVLHPLELRETFIPSPSGGPFVALTFVQTSAETLATLNLTSLDVHSPGAFFTVTSNLTVSRLGAYEFPGLSAMGSAGLWLDRLDFVQTAPYGSASLPVVSA